MPGAVGVLTTPNPLLLPGSEVCGPRGPPEPVHGTHNRYGPLIEWLAPLAFGDQAHDCLQQRAWPAARELYGVEHLGEVMQQGVRQKPKLARAWPHAGEGRAQIFSRQRRQVQRGVHNVWAEAHGERFPGRFSAVGKFPQER